jgi:hypothetical protein
MKYSTLLFYLFICLLGESAFSMQMASEKNQTIPALEWPFKRNPTSYTRLNALRRKRLEKLQRRIEGRADEKNAINKGLELSATSQKARGQLWTIQETPEVEIEQHNAQSSRN